MSAWRSSPVKVFDIAANLVRVVEQDVGVDTESVISELNASTQSRWAYAGRLPGGYQEGAHLLRDPAGTEVVLKWLPHPMSSDRLDELAATVDWARSRGWPTAAWLAAGHVGGDLPYVLFERLIGETVSTPAMATIDAVLELLELQANMNPPTTYDWLRHAFDVAHDDANGHASALARFSPAAAELVRAVTEAKTSGVDRGAGTDLVHGNLDLENLLFRDGRIVGVIDVLACGRGSCIYDLSTLLVVAHLWGWPEEVTQRLLRAGRTAADAGMLFVLAAANLFAILDFGTRHWPEGVDDAAANGLRLLRRIESM
jgi:hypothetical protein